MNFSDRNHPFTGSWRIAEYANLDYVNLLDEHGDMVVSPLRREYAEQIIAGQRLLFATERGESDQ
jgi:hypothetical protein